MRRKSTIQGSTPSAELAPPGDGEYYRHVFDAESTHFWSGAMWGTAVELLGERPHPGVAAAGDALSAGERVVVRHRLSPPYGHTLFALAGVPDVTGP